MPRAPGKASAHIHSILKQAGNAGGGRSRLRAAFSCGVCSTQIPCAHVSIVSFWRATEGDPGSELFRSAVSGRRRPSASRKAGFRQNLPGLDVQPPGLGGMNLLLQPPRPWTWSQLLGTDEGDLWLCSGHFRQSRSINTDWSETVTFIISLSVLLSLVASLGSQSNWLIFFFPS